MSFGTLRVSRFVLALEAALCFAPMTLGWFDVVFGVSGVAWLDSATVERYYLGSTEGVAVLTTILVWAVAGLVGPLGLVVAARHIVFARVLCRGWPRTLLVAAPIIVGAVYFAATSVTGSEWSADRAGFYVLFVAMPLAVAAHLIYLGGTQPGNAQAA